ncbi:glucose 1-dehydrogenase [Salinirubrum litoreum]|uniref:Glucose 1-dehydrogenase n=1 Tax=Salinirubrum litoreum TaxID=1126234 RepID=A0ABD5R780_9EURY|nr:glucose 1-dehydrogenase [Salinirubrum litoreum]
MNGISGKVALVTGGASGIGRATAMRFAEEGASVAVVDVAEDGGVQTVQSIRDMGGEAAFYKADVSSEADWTKLVADVVDDFGSIDCFHNNAGIEGDQAPLIAQTEDNWNRVIDINLKGVFFGLKHVIPQMQTQGGGAIVNTSSVAGLVGYENIAPYVASKHGVVGLTRTAALEHATENIRVNSVNPGVVDTPMVQRFVGDDPEARKAFEATEPVGRFADPEEIASAVVFLCSDDASFVTGYPLAVDGGMVAR